MPKKLSPIIKKIIMPIKKARIHMIPDKPDFSFPGRGLGLWGGHIIINLI